MSIQVITDRSAVDAEIQRVSQLVAEEFSEVLQSQLTDEVREYPRTTIRSVGRGKTGKVAGSPRDVVDTGELVDSFEFNFEINPRILLAVYTWSADHAAKVWFGEGNIPPYPWTEIASQSFDPVESYYANSSAIL